MHINSTDYVSKLYRVCVAMQGQHHLRGSFDTLSEAKEFQAILHAQKWFYVPIYKIGEREPFVNL